MLADVLTTVGANRVITIDLHAPAIQGFFNIPVDHMTALDLISDYLKSKNIKNPVVVSPDAGRASTAEKLANYLDTSFAIMIKKRPAHNESVITHVIGDVEGQAPIIFEDLIDTGSTIVNVVEGLKERGAEEYTFVQRTRCSPARPLSVWIILILKKLSLLILSACRSLRRSALKYYP